MSGVEPIATPSDRELTARVVGDGDEEALRGLFDRHSPRLLRFALRLTAGDGVAEDVVQETWLRAVEGLDRFAWRSTFATWLQGIALNVAREALRRRDGVSVGGRPSGGEAGSAGEGSRSTGSTSSGGWRVSPPAGARSWCSTTSTDTSTPRSPNGWGSR